MIFIKKIIHTAIRQIGKTFRLTQHIPGHHNRDKRLPIHTTNSNAIRIVVNNLGLSLFGVGEWVGGVVVLVG